MLDYVHHVPGRLRVADRRFQNDTAYLKRLCGELSPMPGIVSVVSNHRTGSLTIRYELSQLDSLTMIVCLGALLQTPLLVTAPRGRPSDPARALGRRLGKALLMLLIERLLERSAARLIAALL
jgi:hypothetical protein